jgi:acyl-coenzyme A thioesterase PaaI-like protein
MNKLSKLISKLNKLPLFLKKSALYYTLGNAIKFAGTSGIQYNTVSAQKIIITLRNRPKVQNHIGQIHAAATALLAETATGLMLGMHLPDHKTPLLKTLHIDYIKRSQGNQQAVATLPQEALNSILNDAKGTVVIPVVVKDAVGTEVIVANMTWAWIPKNKLKSRQ